MKKHRIQHAHSYYHILVPTFCPYSCGRPLSCKSPLWTPVVHHFYVLLVQNPVVLRILVTLPCHLGVDLSRSLRHDFTVGNMSQMAKVSLIPRPPMLAISDGQPGEQLALPPTVPKAPPAKNDLKVTDVSNAEASLFGENWIEPPLLRKHLGLLYKKKLSAKPFQPPVSRRFAANAIWCPHEKGGKKRCMKYVTSDKFGFSGDSRHCCFSRFYEMGAWESFEKKGCTFCYGWERSPGEQFKSRRARCEENRIIC